VSRARPLKSHGLRLQNRGLGRSIGHLWGDLQSFHAKTFAKDCEMDPHFREAQRWNICRSTTTRHSLRPRLELVKGRLLEGPRGLGLTEYCICDSILLIAVKGKADTVSMETEDRTPLA
jgi:hypothetical protein